jgi:hypothetical protein
MGVDWSVQPFICLLEASKIMRMSLQQHLGCGSTATLTATVTSQPQKRNCCRNKTFCQVIPQDLLYNDVFEINNVDAFEHSNQKFMAKDATFECCLIQPLDVCPLL